MVVLSVNDLYLADSFLGLIQKIKNSKSDPDKFTFLGGKLAKVTSKSAKFAKVVLISAPEIEPLWKADSTPQTSIWLDKGGGGTMLCLTDKVYNQNVRNIATTAAVIGLQMKNHRIRFIWTHIILTTVIK